MIGYYVLVCGLALVLLLSLMAQVRQPEIAAAERVKTHDAESTVIVLQTQVARTSPTARPTYPGYHP